MARPIKILFVCMGNICRSPMAEGVFKHHVKQAGLDGSIATDSAGTHDYHVGEPPDRRAQRAASRRGYDLSALREVPDPYYGGEQGFERVLDMVEQAAQGLLRHLHGRLIA